MFRRAAGLIDFSPRDGELVDLAEQGFDYCMNLNHSPEWDYSGENITMHHTFTDNWGCTFEVEQILQWNGEEYIFTDQW